jgi:hypothetical protein
MKFNLKNRPKIIPKIDNPTIEEWFNGFQKILEELIGQLEDLGIKQSEKLLIEFHKKDLQAVFDDGYCKGQYELIQEILGIDENQEE